MTRAFENIRTATATPIAVNNEWICDATEAVIIPDVLITQPQVSDCVASLHANFTVHSLFDAVDPDALLFDVGPRIRAIAGGKVSAALMDRLPALEIIANSGVGYDSIDVVAARERSIRVTNTPNVLNDAVAEITIGLMIALARQIPKADRFIREGRWLAQQYPNVGELTGKTLGILGLGRIGKEIAARAQAMKMRVVYHGRRKQLREPYLHYDSLLQMARDVDWLVVIAPGGKETENIVSRDVLEALGPSGYLLNMARGSMVDEEALIEMLGDGRLGGAALDVFRNEPRVAEEFLKMENVILSPHQGSKTVETRNLMGKLLVDNLRAHFAGDPLLTPVV
jgi:lactate dehydrogenase-like 2-hydroxyacid dehydrogenase